MNDILKFFTFIIILFAIHLSSSGCHLSEDNKDTIISVEPEFILEMKEEPGDPPQFAFELKTIDNYPCLNDSIIAGQRILNKKLELNIYQIQPATDCIEGNQPLCRSVVFGNLPVGTYLLKTVLRDIIFSEGRLIAAEETLRLDFKKTHGFRIPRPQIRRVPKQAIWGYIGWEDPQRAGQLPQQLLEELKSRHESLFLAKGYYTPFEIGDAGLLSFHTPPPFLYFKTFYMKISGTSADLKDFLERYHHLLHTSAVTIKIFTWKGDQL